MTYKVLASYRSVSGGSLSLLPVSYSRFFHPTKEFVEWAAKTLRGLPIFDVGAGDGATALVLRNAGLKVTPLDIFEHSEPVLPTEYGDGTRYWYPEGSAVMLCRPCHGDFPYLTLERAIRCNVVRFVYVGLPKNVNNDLGKYRRKFRVALKNAGASGEKVWVWNMREYDVTKNVALVRYADQKDAYWVIDRPDHYWENPAGGRCPKSDKDVVLERSTIVDYDFQSLDWTKSGYMRSEGDYGWLSPEGKFYACDYAEHDQIAYYILKKSVDTLEKEGWVRVDGPSNGSLRLPDIRATFRMGPDKEPNEVQAAWLTARGHDLDPYGFKADEREAQQQSDEKARFEQFVRAGEKATGKKLKRPDGD